MTKIRRLVPAAAAAALLALPAAASAHGRDSDHDGMPNGWEKAHHLKAHKADGRLDHDHDGLRNLAEYKLHTDPSNRDSDADGIPDGRDVGGTIASFTGGVLTITLPDGTTRAGSVDNGTEIECKGPQTATAASHDEGDDNGGGDHRGDNGDRQGAASQTGAPQQSRGGDDDDGDRNQADDGDRNQADDEQDDDGQDQQGNCGPEALTAGAQIHEAELAITSKGAAWTKVEVLK